MIFKLRVSAIKSLYANSIYCFGESSKKVSKVIKTKHNPQQLKQLRGHEQLQLHMTDKAKQYFYIHKKQRKTFSLYNLFAHLPTPVINLIAKSSKLSQTILSSDQNYLPKISQNSIPIYQSVDNFSRTLRIINRASAGGFIPLLFTAQMPYVGVISIFFFYYLLYYPVIVLSTKRYILKMELLPETEQIAYQKITFMGGIRVSRVRVQDLESINPSLDITKFEKNWIFQRATRSVINQKLAFRVKSTGELLMLGKDLIMSYCPSWNDVYQKRNLHAID